MVRGHLVGVPGKVAVVHVGKAVSVFRGYIAVAACGGIFPGIAAGVWYDGGLAGIFDGDLCGAGHHGVFVLMIACFGDQFEGVGAGRFIKSGVREIDSA